MNVIMFVRKERKRYSFHFLCLRRSVVDVLIKTTFPSILVISSILSILVRTVVTDWLRKTIHKMLWIVLHWSPIELLFTIILFQLQLSLFPCICRLSACSFFLAIIKLFVYSLFQYLSDLWNFSSCLVYLRPSRTANTFPFPYIGMWNNVYWSSYIV